MKKVGSLLMAVLLLLNVSFGYTLTVTYNGNQTVREVEGGNTVIVELSSRENANYTVDTDNAILRCYGNRRQFVMPNEAVDISITDLGETIEKYTVTFNSNGGTTVAEKQVTYDSAYGTLEEPTKAKYLFDGWYLDSGLTNKVTNETTVTTANNHTLYAKWAPTPLLMNVGDYVTYTPTATTVDLTTITGVEQTAFNPSETTAWRVLSNDGTTVELVSADSVGNLTIGSTSDMVVAKKDYAEAGTILNTISEAYVDSNVATGGRGLGDKEGSSIEEINTTTYPLTWANTYTNGNNGFPYTDTYYSDDVNALKNNSMLHSSGSVWLASRGLYANSSDACFGVRYVNTSGSVSYNYLFVGYSDGRTRGLAPANGVRPVVILKSDIKITGAGTEGEPWKIN